VRQYLCFSRGKRRPDGARKSRSELAAILLTGESNGSSLRKFLSFPRLPLFPPGDYTHGRWADLTSIAVNLGYWSQHGCAFRLSTMAWTPPMSRLGLRHHRAANLLDPYWPASKLSDQRWPIWWPWHSQMAVQVGPFLFRFVYLCWLGLRDGRRFSESRVSFEILRRGATPFCFRGVALTTRFSSCSSDWRLRGSQIHRRFIRRAHDAITVDGFPVKNQPKYPPSLDYLCNGPWGPAAICVFVRRIA